jgi:hypothetical protein
MHAPVLRALALLACFAAGDAVLITRKGEKFEGPVTREDGMVTVQTVTGPRRFPEAEVALTYENLRDVLQKADERFAEAKRLYEEASKLEEANPARNQKLSLAIEVAQGAVGTYQILQPHYSGPSHTGIPNSIQVMMQFIRLCRGAATTDVVVGTGAKSGVLALEEPSFAFTPPAAAERPWRVAGELGPGLGAALQDLSSTLPERRLEAVKRLTHPPSPLHLSALLKLLEAEREPAVLRAISDGLGFMDSSVVLKSLAWARKESDAPRRAAAFAILQAIGDRAAFEFASGWFEESPPATHHDRAEFASIFRRFHGQAIPQLKELLTRNRGPRVQAETIRQLGAIGDKTAGPMLLKTIAAYPKDSAVSLLKLGKPAIPTLIEGARSTDNETHRICLHFLRKLTGINQINLVHFETWWGTNRKTVQDDEKAWWDDQSTKGWAVEAALFSTYDLPMERIVP